MNFKPLKNRVWLSSPTMHGDEQKWVDAAFESNWVSTFGENLDEIENAIPKIIGKNYAVALSSGTAALHLAIKLCGEKLYGQPKSGHGTLEGHKVFCTDMTFAATVNPVSYENGEAIFIDTERDTWNMDPKALEKAFQQFPDVKLVVLTHLYGTPAKIDEIKAICNKYDALIVEDAAESFGATYNGKQTGSFGDIGIISFNGNKIITGSTGGMLFSDILHDVEKIKKWSTQSREKVLWYHHCELGYNYRMSNIIAGVIRGQLPYLEEHIALKKAIYERYREGFKDLPVTMNPFGDNVEPNYWLSCMLINKEAVCKQSRNGLIAQYEKEQGKTCPTEILSVLSSYMVEGRPLWRPMHMQPIYENNPFVSLNGEDVGADLFNRGLCLPSDNKMTPDEQDSVIAIVRSCFE